MEIVHYLKKLEERVAFLESSQAQATKPRPKEDLLQEAARYCLRTGKSLRKTLKIKKYNSNNEAKERGREM